jgi:hypothetical protein
VIDPRELPIDEPFTPSPYPRSFVERPVVLPRGMRTFSIAGSIGRQAIGDYRVRYGGGSVGVGLGYDGFAVDLGANFNIYDEHNIPDASVDVPLIQRLYAGVTWQLPSESYVDVTAVLGNVSTRYQRYSPSVSIGHKFRPSDRGAIYVNGAVDYNRENEELNDGSPHVSHRVAAYAGGTARIQATPLLAVQASGSVAQAKYVDDRPRMVDAYRSISASAAVMISVSETADVSAFVGVSSTGSVDVTSGGLTVTMRAVR